jgi:hypothetical protein
MAAKKTQPKAAPARADGAGAPEQRRAALRAALEREAEPMARAAIDVLLQQPLSALLEPEALAAAASSVLRSEHLVPAVRRALRAGLDRELERARRSDETLGALLPEESARRLRKLAGDPRWFGGPWARRMASNEVLERVMGTTLYEVLREFTLTVNPFFSSWGLPALIKKAGPLGRIGLFGMNLEAGGRVLESMREEFERQLEPHIKTFLSRSAKAALLRAVSLAQSEPNLEAFAKLRVEMFDEALGKRLGEVAGELEAQRLDEAEELIAGLAADAVGRLRQLDLRAGIAALQERHGQRTASEALGRAGVEVQELRDALARALLPAVRTTLCSEPLIERLEQVFATL